MYLDTQTSVPAQGPGLSRPLVQPACVTPAARYTRTARILHWVCAIVILWAMITGMLAASMESGTALKTLISSLNVSLTATLIPFFIWRIAHRLAHPAPRDKRLSEETRYLAQQGHLWLYVVTSVVLISGVLMMDHSISWFGLVEIPTPIQNPSLNAGFNRLHAWSSRALALMVFGHLVAVFHHHARGYNVMSRMV